MPAFDESQRAPSGPTHLAGLKSVCYVVCLLALFLSVSSEHIARFGLFLLALFAPLSAARWLRSGKYGEGKMFLLLAVCSAAGVLAGGSGLSCWICFFLSLLFWSIYLCCCAFGEKPLRELLRVVLFTLFSNPSAYFADLLQDWGAKRKRLARYAYTFYLLAAVFTGLILLLSQANSHFSGIFQTLAVLILRKVPLAASCLLLALFPAAFVYGFLKELKIGVVPAEVSESTRAADFPEIPWGHLLLLLTAVNWSLLIVELYYTVYLKDAPPPENYRFYDVFVVLLLLLISTAAVGFGMHSTAYTQKKPEVWKYVSLSISGAGLAILICWRLGMYIYYHGLWKDRILFCLLVLLSVPPLLQIFIRCSVSAWTRCAGCTVAIMLAIALICPKGLFLTEVNAQIFIHKYNAQQLSAQRAGQMDTPTPLSGEDLRMDRIEDYGIEAVPALTWLVRIEDVAYQDRLLGEYARSAILDCLCEDLRLTRTGDDAEDLTSIYSVYADVPRYRLPTRYALALQYLDRVKDSFD